MKFNGFKYDLIEEQQTREKTANEWMPISDIEGKIVYRKDNKIVGVMKIEPINLDLLSQREKRKKVELLTEQLNGEMEDLQIFCIGRPIDLDNYLGWLKQKIVNEEDFVKKNLLKGYIYQAVNLASAGEVTERKFYIIVSKTYYSDAEYDLISRLEDLERKFKKAELTVSICEEDELLKLYTLFSQPVYADIKEVIQEIELPSILEF